MTLEITENTTSFNCNVGDNFIRYDNNHNKIVDITIINIKSNIKSNGKNYGNLIQFKCNTCGFDCKDCYIDGEYREEYWIVQNKFKTRKCGCCNGSIVKKEINSIHKTNPKIIKYLVDENDGNKYSKGSNVKIKCHCSCGKRIDYVCVSQLTSQNKFTCDNCSTKISYPNKFMFNILKFCNIDFVQEKIFDWDIEKYKRRYDFYIPSLNTIIELNGRQHYEEVKYFKRTLEESIKNDKFKKELALKNGIEHYFYIDCSSSNVDFIKKSIIKSGLLKIIDSNEKFIDWEKCSEQSINRSVVDVANEYNNGFHSRREISRHLEMKERLVKKYIKIAYENNLLIGYNPESAVLESRFKNKIVCFEKENIYYEMTISEINKSNIFIKKFSKSALGKHIREQKPIEGIILKYKGE